MNGQAVEDMAALLSRSRKGSAVHPDAIRRILAEEATKNRTPRDTLRAAKRKLHQIHGAFIPPHAFPRAHALLSALEDGAHLDETCRSLLQLHASTAERLSHYERFYAGIFAITGPVQTLLDVGCGFNPFSLPLMGSLRPHAYHAYDADLRAVALVRRFLHHVGREPLAEARDILTRPPDQDADVALLLKMLPTLDRQKKDAGLALVRDLRVHWVVVSLPAKTLSRRDKGMARHYEEMYGAALEREFCVAGHARYSNELVFVVRKG
jgi:16S rRNA (guanine(1405)-N(7))-methyltransferase